MAVEVSPQRRDALDYWFPKTPENVAPILGDAKRIAEISGAESHDLLVVLGSVL